MSEQLLAKYQNKNVIINRHGRQGNGILVNNLSAGAWGLVKIKWQDQAQEDNTPIILTKDMIQSLKEDRSNLVFVYPQLPQM